MRLMYCKNSHIPETHFSVEKVKSRGNALFFVLDSVLDNYFSGEFDQGLGQK